MALLGGTAFAAAASAEPTLNPILFMGGWAASSMHADVNSTSTAHWYCSSQVRNYKLWKYYSNILPFRWNCFRDRISLRWENGKIKDFGVEIKLVGDHLKDGTDISAGFSLDLWSPLLSSISKLGYNGSSPFVGAMHYDWRLGPLELAGGGLFMKMKRTIEMFVARSLGKRAVLVTLSYGSLLMHKFLAAFVDTAWKRQHVERWITLSAMFGGTAIVTRMAFYPLPSDLNYLPYLPWAQSESWRNVMDTFPSTFVQHPTYKRADEVLISAGGRSYASGDTADALVDAGLLGAKAVFESTRDEYVFDKIDAPGVAVDCLYGIGADTITSMHFGKGFNRSATNYTYEDGDGVGTKRSMGRCLEWQSTSMRIPAAAPADNTPPPTVSIYEIPNADHGRTLSHIEALKIFSRIIHDVHFGNAGSTRSHKGAHLMFEV